MHNDHGESSLGGGGLLQRKSVVEHAEFDITAMIDLVFMMNIYFLVTMVTAGLAEVNLPPARHCLPADPDQCVIITVLEGPEGEPAVVYLGNKDEAPPLSDPEDQEQRIREAIEKGLVERRNIVLVKAEKNVRLKDIGRLGAIASSIPGTDLKLAVLEKE